MPKYICDSQKYQLAGPKEDSIGLTVQIANLPKEIEVEGYKLSLKTTFHASLVCIGKIIEKYKVSRPDFINEIVSDFCSFTKNKSIDFIRFRNEFRFVVQNERRSVIVMCDISNLEEFYGVINKKYGLKIEPQPTHITLYTLQPDTGIFLIDNGDIDNLSKVIVPPLILEQALENQTSQNK